jgi:hypothetical protein
MSEHFTPCGRWLDLGRAPMANRIVEACLLLMLWTTPPPAHERHGRGVLLRSPQAITTIGLDIAKWVFQVHGVDAKAI